MYGDSYAPDKHPGQTANIHDNCSSQKSGFVYMSYILSPCSPLNLA